MPAFLFTDIEGSTRLWEQYPQVMSGALSRHNLILTSIAENAKGEIVKSTGDGFLILFEAGNPLEAAVQMQLAMQAEDWPDQIGQLRIRIGVHTGGFERRGEDIYGSEVNRAARVMDAAWGGQILITADAKTEYKLPADTSLQDLGAHVLKDLYEPQLLYGLIHPDLESDFPPPRSLSSQPNNLPILPTEFVGRQEEIKAIGDLLRNNTCRMVTLHGPGGIGKTRLSIQAGMSYLKHYPFGVYFVSLAPLNSPTDIWPAIASAVSLPIYQDRPPKDQVLNYLKQKELLLVLDNFEHLTSGASLVNELLEAAPKIQVLVTSRTRLHLQKECVFEVDGLQFPSQADQEVFESFEAVQLFSNLAQRANPGYQLKEDQRTAIVEICQLMDGMPLGIELAAHWVRVISPQEIAAELREDIELLKTDLVDVPDRHRSMRAMFDYSWKLLDDREKQTLKALSIFRGGCTLAAAKQVADASLIVLSGLVDKSLVRRTDAARYEMHELVRQLTEEKLEADDEEHLFRHRKHSEYYLSRLAEREADLKGKDQINALDEFDADFENLRMAWKSAVEAGQADLIGKALESFFWMLTYRNHYAAGQELFAQAGKQWADPAEHPELVYRLRIRFPQESVDLEKLYQEAVDSARERDAKRELAIAINCLGRYIGHVLLDVERGAAVLEESLALFEQLGDDFYIGHVLDDISFTYGYIDLTARTKYAEKSLAVRERSGDLFGTAGVLGNLVVSQFWKGEIDKIESYTKRALEIAKQTNDVRNIAWQHIYLAELRQFEGQLEEALDFILKAEKISEDIFDTDLNIQVKINKAMCLTLLKEDYRQSKQLLEDAIPLDTELNMHKANATMVYGLVAAGLGDLETLRTAAKFPFEAAKYIDFGTQGLNWFSPILILDLFHRGKFSLAAECFGFTLEQGMIADRFFEKWPVLDRIVSRMKETLGEQEYLAAIERGKSMSIFDFQPYILNEETENPSN